MQTVTLNNGVEMPILGSASTRSPPTRPSRSSPRRSRPATATSTPPPPTGTRRPSAGPIASSGIPREELFVTTKLWIQTPARTQHQARLRAVAASGWASTTSTCT